MWWSKKKNTEDAAINESNAKDEIQQTDTSQGDESDEKEYPGLKIVLPVILSVCAAGFLTALDRTIVGVAVPSISNEFNSFGDISCANTFFPAKWTFIAVVVIFEIGSIICAAAPSSVAFIIGRAISGVGSAGATTGALVIFVDLIPLQKRPKYFGFLGATFGLAAIAGPLLGGVFTTKVSWRWCFWINVPIGGVSILLLLLFLPAKPAPRKNDGKSIVQRLKQFDPVGTAFLLPGLVILVLVLQWVGTGHSWGSTQVIVPLVLSLVLLLAFGGSQLWSGENGTVPPRIIRQRTMAAASVVSLGFGSALVIITFYLPIWYQAIKGESAVSAGIKLLPYFLGTVVFVIGSGILVSKMGYYTPVLMVGTAVIIVGCGLLTTFEVHTSKAVSYGYQVVTSIGLGLSLTQPNTACQTVLSREDIPIGVTIISFAQFFGGTIFVTVCQTVLSNTLVSRLRSRIPTLDAAALSKAGATNLASLVSKKDLPVLLAEYNIAIRNVFYVALAVSCLAFVASFFLEWKTVKKQADLAVVG